MRHKIIAYIGIILNPEDEPKLMALARQKLLSLIKDKSAKQGKASVIPVKNDEKINIINEDLKKDYENSLK